jgi:hypothetical protein
MDLHQIQVTYQPNEDRILCQASFKAEDGALQEVRAWLTRRLVKSLWIGIIEALETQVTLDKPQAAHASAEIVGMEHQACVTAMRDSGSFNNAYETGVQSHPLGEVPMLVSAASFSTAPDQPIRINFTSADNRGFEIAFMQPVLHGFCTLLKDAVKNAQWDMNLVLPGMATLTAAPFVLN